MYSDKKIHFRIRKVVDAMSKRSLMSSSTHCTLKRISAMTSSRLLRLCSEGNVALMYSTVEKEGESWGRGAIQ